MISNGGSVVSGYKLYQTNVTTGGEFLVYDGTNIPTVTQVTISKVVASLSYKYRVVAINRVGTSDYSPFSLVIVASKVPKKPD